MPDPVVIKYLYAGIGIKYLLCQVFTKHSRHHFLVWHGFLCDMNRRGRSDMLYNLAHKADLRNMKGFRICRGRSVLFQHSQHTSLEDIIHIIAE